MSSIADIKRYQEATDMLAALQGDVSQIENGVEAGDIPSVENGWQDLASFIQKNPEFADLFHNANSSAANKLQQVSDDTKSYLQGVQLVIEQPNSPGNFIPLYSGTDSYLNGYVQNDLHGQANLFGLITGEYSSLTNYYGDAFSDPGLGTDWSESSSLQRFSCWDHNPNDNGQYNSYEGTPDQWAPYIHFSGGDHSALDNDLFKA